MIAFASHCACMLTRQCCMQRSQWDSLAATASLHVRCVQLPGGTCAALSDYTALIQRCWADPPEERPSMEQASEADCIGWGAPAVAARRAGQLHELGILWHLF